MAGEFRLVGENAPEYLYVPEGSKAVVAPMANGEEPTLHHAVVAIMSMMAQNHADKMSGARGAASEKLPGAAAGDFIDTTNGGGNPGFAAGFAKAFPGVKQTGNGAYSVDTSSGQGIDLAQLLAGVISGNKQLSQAQSQFNTTNQIQQSQFGQNQTQQQNQFREQQASEARNQANQMQMASNQISAQRNKDMADAQAAAAKPDDMAAQLANALQIAREGNANAMSIAQLQANTALQGQDKNYAIAAAGNKLTARQQLAERATRQLVGPGSAAIPTLSV